jgi:CDGSH-type Zn-finger protein
MTQQPQSSTTVALAAGTHWICTCGRSSNFPYCDGGHKGTAFQPLALELEAPKVVEISM